MPGSEHSSMQGSETSSMQGSGNSSMRGNEHTNMRGRPLAGAPTLRARGGRRAGGRLPSDPPSDAMGCPLPVAASAPSHPQCLLPGAPAQSPLLTVPSLPPLCFCPGSAITGPVAKECADLWPRVAAAANTIV